MCSSRAADDPSQHDLCGGCNHPGHWRECRAPGCYCRRRGPSGSQYPGCDHAPSSMTGHAGRCGSYDEHVELIRQGIGIGPNPTGASTTASDHGRQEWP